ncbi:MAG: OadG family protein [Magnetococcales bacterium]|nr:OadG family protein [Magnetococcales bacterium]
MPWFELISGLTRTLLGAGLLFVFMSLLHFLVGQMSLWCARHEAGWPGQPTPDARSVAERDDAQERIAAVAVAIHHYRARLHRKKE